MGKKANPTVIGGFIVGAIVLVTAGLLIFGSGRLFKTQIGWVSDFEDPVKGLQVGAPVTLRGAKIGQVADIKVVVDPDDNTVRAPVYWEIDPDQLVGRGEFAAELQKRVKEGEVKGERPIARYLIKRGLRAQLKLQSFVTGQKFIELDFHPGTAIRLVGVDPTVQEFPTIRSGMAKLTQSIEELPLNEIGDAALSLLEHVDQLMTSEVKQTIVSAKATVEQYKELGRHIDEEVLPSTAKLVERLDSQVTPAAQEALTDASKLMRNIDEQVVPPAHDTLKQAEATLAEAEGAIGKNSQIRNRLALMLAELTAAARSIRVLAAYLERHPEALIAGKGGPGGDRR
ncbi:MAG: MlaD family protein [Candidatus Methylomirabilales bacterium]